MSSVIAITNGTLGSMGFGASTYTFSAQSSSQGVTQSLIPGDSIQFSRKTNTEYETYTITLSKISINSVNLILDTSQNDIRLKIGETKKITLSSTGFYDLSVKLESVTDNSAEITIQTIHELIQIEQPIFTQSNTTNTNQNGYNSSSSKFFTKTKIIWGVIIIMVLIILVYIRSLRRNIHSYRPSSPTHFTSYRIVK
jgi:hypothetical protein